MKEKIRDAYKQMGDAYNKGYKAIVELLKEKGGFIATNNKNGDSIYGYDFLDDLVTEVKVFAIRLVEDKYIECYVAEYERAPSISITDWDKHTDDDYDTYFEGESDGYWFNINDGLPVFTTFNILESIGCYVD